MKITTEADRPIGRAKAWRRGHRLPRRCGFTIVEVAVASAVAILTITGLLLGYTVTTQRAEWSAHSLAANSMAMERIEQTRACKWDFEQDPQIDELVNSNFPTVVNALDLPVSGTNVVWATNTTTISTVSTNPPLKSVYVECTWRFIRTDKVFTNAFTAYRSPDT